MAAGTVVAEGATAWVTLPEGTASIVIHGTWASVTATLQLLAADGATAVDVTDGAWTANVVTQVDLGGGAKVRLSFAGAGSPTPDLDWEIHPSRSRTQAGPGTGEPLWSRY